MVDVTAYWITPEPDDGRLPGWNGARVLGVTAARELDLEIVDSWTQQLERVAAAPGRVTWLSGRTWPYRVLRHDPAARVRFLALSCGGYVGMRSLDRRFWPCYEDALEARRAWWRATHAEFVQKTWAPERHTAWCLPHDERRELGLA